jgi:hypothetical protein
MPDSATLNAPASLINEDLTEYRSMSSGAIVGLILGILAVLAPIAGASSFEACLFMCAIPLAGILVSLRSVVAIRRMPHELAGKRVAIAGLVLSIFFLIGGIGYGAYIYATEVPDGYERISFAQMEPSRMDLERGIAVPNTIAELDGAHVFVKGYMRPPATRSNITKFLLVRDNNQCCFGALSKVRYHDQIQVELVKPMTTDYELGVFRLAGKLHVHPQNATQGNNQPVFTLTADYLK